MAQTAGQDNPRGDPNLRSELRRFARTNAATALSVAIATAAAPIKVSTPPHKPRATLRVVQEAAKAPKPAIAPPAPAPAPQAAAPAPAPAAPAQPVTAHQPPQDPMATTAANDAKATAKRSPSVRMTRPDFHKLTKHIESIDVTAFDTMVELAASCAKTLGIVVTHTHVKDAVDVLEITHFKRVRMPVADEGKLALELARATALQFIGMCELLGTRPDADYLKLLADKHDIALPAAGQKVA